MAGRPGLSWTHQTMKRVWNITPRNPSFDLENREMRLALQNMDGTEQKIPFSLIFHLFFAAASPTDHTCLCMMVISSFVPITLSLLADSNSSSIHSAMLCIVIHKISTALPTQSTGHILREAARGMRERQIGKKR